MASLAFAVYKLSFFRGAWLLDLCCIGLNFSFPIIQKIAGCTIACKEARAGEVAEEVPNGASNEYYIEAQIGERKGYIPKNITTDI